MKRALSVLLAVVMVMALSPFLSVNAAAATTNDQDQGALTQGFGGNYKALSKFGPKDESNTDEPKAKEVIVQFKDSDDPDLSNAEADTVEEIEAMAETNGFTKTRKKVQIADGITVAGDAVWEFDDGSKSRSLTVGVASSSSLSTEKLIKKLQSEEIVEAVSPNFKRHAFDVSKDPYEKFQWALQNYSETGGTSAETEWETNTGNAENIVAVVDTGINYKHPDLRDQMWKNKHGSKLKGTCGFDFVNSDIDPIDDDGHGSHCAGIIGAATNGGGTQGVCPQVRLMALKVLDETGGGYDSDIIAAYNYIYKAMDLGEPIVAVSCSFGGGDYDEVMEKVYEKVGKKGAISVCAAGNEAMNTDEEAAYPACYDSNYIISVAATKKGGDLVSFSNYGAESVDIAAPGTDILSTVSYDCFNPTLYRDGFVEDGDGSDDNPMQQYLDGSESSVDTILTPAPEGYAYTNLDNEDPEKKDIVSDEDAGFYSSDGALKIQFNKQKTGTIGDKWQYFAIPYKILGDIGKDDDVALSLMARTEGPEELTLEQYFNDTYDKLLLMDVPLEYLKKDTEEHEKFFTTGGESLIYEYASDMIMVYGDEDYWTHLTINLSDSIGTVSASDEGEQPISKDRALLVIGDSQAGNFTAYIDDIGISKCTDNTGVFGQYDFYSGTSMATPATAGAAALVAAADKGKDGYGPEMVIGDLLSMANDSHALSSDSKKTVSTGGAVDFANKGNGFWIGLNSVTVDIAKKEITLGGRFEGDVTVNIKEDEDEVGQDINLGTISSPTDKLVLNDEGWINNVVDITVEGDKGGKKKKAHRWSYLVNGKKKYETEEDGAGVIQCDATLATNGKLIYMANSDGDIIWATNPNDLEDSMEEIAVFTKEKVQKYFSTAAKDKLSDTAAYDFRFGDDLVQIGGNLYVKGFFCEVTGSGNEEEDDWSDGTVSASAISDDDDEDEEERFPDSTGAVYSEEMVLFCVNIKSGSITTLKVPAGIGELTDSKLASYNGNLYMLGGIDESDNTFSDKVSKYNATKKKWDEVAEMPYGRAGGKVLQSGNKLIYTMGYDEDSELAEDGTAALPGNYVFDGSSWEPCDGFGLNSASVVSRGDKEYVIAPGSVGICKNGLVYMGVPAADLGDTFTYDANKDSFKTTDWNYARNTEDLYMMASGEKLFNGLAVGSKIIGSDEKSNLLIVKGAITSGLLKVSEGKKNAGGKITGTGNYMPGASCTIKAAANPGYYAKSMTGAGKTKVVAKGLSVTTAISKDVKVNASFAKATVKCKDKITVKRGKTASLNAKITPAAAAKQWKLAYKSSNTKYATVSAKGVVKATKKGKGKTVKISVMLKGTNKVMKTVKVKIK